MKNSGTQAQYTAVARNNQLVLILNSEIKLPEDAPVRVTSAQLEELESLMPWAPYIQQEFGVKNSDAYVNTYLD